MVFEIEPGAVILFYSNFQITDIGNDNKEAYNVHNHKVLSNELKQL